MLFITEKNISPTFLSCSQTKRKRTDEGYLFKELLFIHFLFPFPSCQDKEEQWMTKLVPGANDFAILQPLQWNTRYEVEITARNVKGLSEPTFYQFFMPQEPDITGKSMLSGNVYSLSFESPFILSCLI